MIPPQAHNKSLPLPPALIILMGAILEALVTDDILSGTPDTLAATFAATPDGFLACLDGLVRAGWVTVSIDPDDRWRIELEP